jgi:hypothetical protein
MLLEASALLSLARVLLFDTLHRPYRKAAAKSIHKHVCCSKMKLTPATQHVGGGCGVAAVLHARDVV